MKITKEYIRNLIVETLEEEADVIQGKFGGGPSMDLGAPASVTSIASKMKSGSGLPEGTEWLEDASSLIDEIMNNINEIATADESLAERLFDLAEKLSPIFKSGKETMSGVPAGAFEDDPERDYSTERSYEPSEPDEDDL